MPSIFERRLLLKQLVKLEVIQWPAFWSTFKDEFKNEKNMLEGAPVEKAAEVLRQRIVELALAELCLFSSFWIIIQM